MLKAFSGNHTFDIAIEGGKCLVDGKSLEWDVVKLPDGRWHSIAASSGFTAEVIDRDNQTGTVTVRLGGVDVQVRLRTRLEERLDQMGMQQRQASPMTSVVAPMPGKITSIRVEERDEVKTGSPLLVLEAMKMENVIQSPGDGAIRSVKVRLGDLVEKGQVLIEFC